MSSWDRYAAAIVLPLLAILAGCGSTHGTASGPVASTISLTPPSGSLEMGETVQLTATAENFSKQALTIPITYNSSNTAVLTISNAGLVCAGTWDSLVAPVRCAPGPAGVAQVVASSGGVNSPPSTFYVHAHIDNISIALGSPLPTNVCNLPNSSTIGISANQTLIYQATAFSQGNDITGTIGPTGQIPPGGMSAFTWSATDATVVKLSTTATGLFTNQVQATSFKPGRTQIFASAGAVTSSSVDFVTCPVQSITLGISGGSGNVINFAKSGSQTITATVTDLAGITLPTLPTLMWSSSAPLIASAVANGDIGGTATAHLSGGATIIASCTPPTCNPGFVPPLPVYPNTAISVTVAPASTPATTNVYAATTGCRDNFGCTSSVVQIAVPANTIGNSATLPNTPNSFLFDFQGKTGYLGSKHGLMVFSPASLGSSTNPIAVHSNITGKVLAISHNGNKVIVSDTSSNPNQVFVFDTTSTGSTASFPITGATAAAFSLDDLKAYIAAGSNLYVYSTLEPLQTISLGTASAADLAFLPEGALMEVAGGANAGGAVTDIATTCPTATAVGASAATSGTPIAIRPLLDGTRLLALDPPGIDVITVTPAAAGNPSCPPSNTSAPVFANLGQGQFKPLKFLVASDGSKAYVLAANFGAVMVYDVASGTSPAIGLSGNATILDGDLTLDGRLLYIGGSDGKVHIIDTAAGADTQAISFPSTFNFCNNFSSVCQPDLITVQP